MGGLFDNTLEGFERSQGYQWDPELGWAPLFDFDSGLRATVQWYLDHQDWCEEVTTDRYYGGRLGLNTWLVLEVVVVEMLGLDASRRLDPESGLKLLRFLSPRP